MLTMQEAFDKAARGVIEQGRPSVTKTGNCRYTGENGERCGVGQLVDDRGLRQRMDEYGAITDAPLWLLKEAGLDGLDLEFLTALQNAHDAASPALAVGTRKGFIAEFRDRMKCVARAWDLNPEVLL